MPLQLPVPDVISLDLLKSVAELGSIRQAALAHNVSQPAASMRIRSLEKALGISLLLRSNGRAQLTPEGEAVVEWSEPVLEKMNDLLGGTAALKVRDRSTLRIAASMTVAEYLVPVWINRMNASMPDIATSLAMGNSEQIMDVIRSGNADIGFVEGWRIPHDLESREVVKDSLVVVVAPSHPWSSRKKIVTPRELARTPLVMREKGSGTREVFERALHEQGLSPATLSVLSSNTAIKAMVGSGTAPGVLSRLVTRHEVESGKLAVANVRGMALSRSINAVWLKHKQLSHAARRLLGLIEG